MSRLYYETEEIVVKKKKGWVDIDSDFTQVYDCFADISKHINNPTSWKLLFWLLANESNKHNGFRTNASVRKKFNSYLTTNSIKPKPIAKQTFYNALDELEKAKAITQVERGFYYFSAFIFWRNNKEERLQFIENEARDKSYNPKAQKLLKEGSTAQLLQE